MKTLTEEEWDAVYDAASAFYDEYIRLVAKTLVSVPIELRRELEDKIQEYSNMYSSAYRDYMQEGSS